MKYTFGKSLKPALLTTVFVAILSGGTSAFAHGNGGMMGGGYGGYGPCQGGSMGPGMEMGMMGPGMGMGMGMMGGSMMGGPGYGQGYGYGNPMGMMNLSDEQRQRMFDIQKKVQEERWEHMGDMQEAMADLQREMTKENPDQEAVTKAYQKMSDIRLEMMREGLDGRRQMMEILNKEQRQQFRGMMGPGMGMMQ